MAYIVFDLDPDTMTVTKVLGTCADPLDCGPRYENREVIVNCPEWLFRNTDEILMTVPYAVKYLDRDDKLPVQEQKPFTIAWLEVPGT